MISDYAISCRLYDVKFIGVQCKAIRCGCLLTKKSVHREYRICITIRRSKCSEKAFIMQYLYVFVHQYRVAGSSSLY